MLTVSGRLSVLLKEGRLCMADTSLYRSRKREYFRLFYKIYLFTAMSYHEKYVNELLLAIFTDCFSYTISGTFPVRVHLEIFVSCRFLSSTNHRLNYLLIFKISPTFLLSDFSMSKLKKINIRTFFE